MKPDIWYNEESKIVKFTCPKCDKVNMFSPPRDGGIGDTETVMCTGCKQVYPDVHINRYPTCDTSTVDRQSAYEACWESLQRNKSSMVNHPAHYQSETGLEVIDVIEAFTFDLKGVEGFDTGNILKYVCRWKNKNGLEDLKKAKWYLDHLINHVEKLEKENE